MLAGAINYRLHHGDCLDILPTLPDASIDAIITDPPYPYIKRPYGYWTEAEWMPMMQEAVRQSRRILKPSGSMVIILQPNSEKVGSMRLWLWRFMLWAGEEWNIVQDAYWWNWNSPPTVHTHSENGLMRPSLKSCLWIGNASCYRNQFNVLWDISDFVKTANRQDRALKYSSSGYSYRKARADQTALNRGGVTPFNVLPLANSNSITSAGANGHGAGTPLKLCDWWTRYLCPPGGVVGDWFAGTATTGIAALQNGCSYVGIEKMDEYIPIAEKRLSETMPLFQEAG